MRFLLYTLYGDGLGLAWRLKREGNDVRVYCAKPDCRGVLSRMVDLYDNFNEALKGVDVVIFDMVKVGVLADRLKREGYAVIGGGKVCDKLELDRDFSLNLMKNLGIAIPKMKTFTNIPDAIQFVLDNKKTPWVLKPENNAPTSMTFVAQDNSELIANLEYWRDKRMLRGPFVLQEFIKGVEVSTEIFFSNGVPIYPVNSTLETKKFLSYDLGQNTGCQTSVVWNYAMKEPRLYQMGLKKALLLFEKAGYSGPVDLNTIVSSKDEQPYGLEFTARFGYNALYALMELIEGDAGKVIADIAQGKAKTIPVKSGFGTAVRISIPPYPTETGDPALNRAIYRRTAGIPVGVDFNEPGYIPLDVSKEGDTYYTMGTDNVVLEATGWGYTIEGAGNAAYMRAKNVRLPNKQYRTDMIWDAQRRFNGLKQMRYIFEGSVK